MKNTRPTVLDKLSLDNKHMNSALTESLDETASPTSTLNYNLVETMKKGTQLSHAQIVTYRNCEVLSECLFKPLTLWLIQKISLF